MPLLSSFGPAPRSSYKKCMTRIGADWCNNPQNNAIGKFVKTSPATIHADLVDEAKRL